MKKIILAAFAATTLTVAAQDQQIIVEDDRAIEATLSGGYLFDLDEAFASLEITNSCDTTCIGGRWGVKLTHASDDLDFGLGRLDSNLFLLGVSYRQHVSVADSISVYGGGGAGLAYVDSTVRTNLGGRRSDDDATYYVEVNAGIRKEFTENFFGHLGVKAIHIHNTYLFNNLPTDFTFVDFGVELGFTYSF